MGMRTPLLGYQMNTGLLPSTLYPSSQIELSTICISVGFDDMSILFDLIDIDYS